ncbi:MBL fold metallo-hydrolase [Robiginitalea sp. SC105]|uniref:MBL fold metallo-hydrolase n=1 Tax=Robiginitalea sp. SC105 TaxID=2762332 RepID=UPI00163AD63D|nr:MBL fold metallo-hydrolase [Robiginitalea sp. SC105]MBC2840661.1 MBL fold metallo-hydrolase [Robiginitalea sp. SC105]
MKITFLGTGTSQGIPVIGSTDPVCLSEDPRDKRLRVSVMVTYDDGYNCVVDCGPDFRQQMLTHNVNRLDAIVFTHEHADHTAGMDDIRPFFFRQGDIPIHAHPRVVASLQRRFDYIFTDENRYPGAPSVAVNTVEKGRAFRLGSHWVTPVDALHNRLQVFGYRFGDFAYLTDVKSIEKEEANRLEGVRVLVVNALREEAHHSHFNLEEALEFINRVGPETAYLTHISHRLGFHAEVESRLPENVFLAYDNLTLNL